MDELRSRKKFRDYSEQQLANLLHTLKSFSRIVYGIWAKKQPALRNQAVLAHPAGPDQKTIVLKPTTSKRKAA